MRSQPYTKKNPAKFGNFGFLLPFGDISEKFKNRKEKMKRKVFVNVVVCNTWHQYWRLGHAFMNLCLCFDAIEKFDQYLLPRYISLEIQI